MTSSTATRGRAVRGKNAQGGPSLGEALLPTLRVNEHKAGGYQVDPSGRIWLTLSGMLPTLTARDWRSGGASEATHARNARPLNETLGRSVRGSGCLLDPGWCEAFMGFPEGWTDPGSEPAGPPPAYEPLGSTPSGTPSSRRKSSRSGA